jgi:hypothetical protein
VHILLGDSDARMTGNLRERKDVSPSRLPQLSDVNYSFPPGVLIVARQPTV